MAVRKPGRIHCIICGQIRKRFDASYEAMLNMPWRVFCKDHIECVSPCDRKIRCNHETYKQMFSRLKRREEFGLWRRGLFASAVIEKL